jgi:hypothetical protein
MTLVIEGLEETLAALVTTINKKKIIAEKAVRSAGLEYERDVKKLAPVLTGQYRGSIHVEPSTGAYQDFNGSPFVTVGTDLPQAKRLEFGFFDMTDRIGRHYYQRPRPHFRPPLDLNLAKYKAIMKGEFDRDVSYENYTSMTPGVY